MSAPHSMLLVVPSDATRSRSAGDAVDERTAGGKASTLARLIALDVPVPEGVVLTCQAFEAFLGSASSRTRIEASPRVAR